MSRERTGNASNAINHIINELLANGVVTAGIYDLSVLLSRRQQ